MAKKERIINREFKTLFFDFDGTLFDTKKLMPYVERRKALKWHSLEWYDAQKECIAHIKDCMPYEGWQSVWDFIVENNIQAAIVSGNSRDMINRAVSIFNLRSVFPKDKYNRIGRNDVKGHDIRKEGKLPLFIHALEQLGEDPTNVIAFGNNPMDAMAASEAGIKAYHCLWGAGDDRKELMLADTDHQCLSSPLQIIDILNSERTSQSQATKTNKQ